MQRGYSLLELIVALTLGALLASTAAALLQSHARLARNAGARALRSETFRTAAHVLATETRWLNPLRDVRAVSTDSLALRAFRLSGVVCHVNADGSAIASTQGMRLPDPAKDSVLIVRGPAQEYAARLLLAAPAPAGCSPAAEAFLLRLSLPLQSGDLLLVFESGNYYLSGKALRYRLGSEGRQPLTNEAFEDRTTAFIPVAQGVVAWLSIRSQSAATELRHVQLPFLNSQ